MAQPLSVNALQSKSCRVSGILNVDVVVDHADGPRSTDDSHQRFKRLAGFGLELARMGYGLMEDWVQLEPAGSLLVLVRVSRIVAVDESKCPVISLDLSTPVTAAGAAERRSQVPDRLSHRA